MGRKRGGDAPRQPVVEGPSLAEHLAPFARERTWLLPALQAAQRAVGWLPLWALDQVAQHVRVPRSEVYGVATHFPELRMQPAGRHLVRVCTGVPCRVNGGLELLQRAREQLGVAPGETSTDGAVTLEEIGCAFACSMAPVAEIDHDYVAGALAWEGVDARHREPALPESAGLARSPMPPLGHVAATPLERLEFLRDHLAADLTQTRLLVGAGMCAGAVGANAVVAALRAAIARRGMNVRLVEAGCDGACFRAVQVTVLRPNGPPQVLERVNPSDVESLLDLAQGAPAGPLADKVIGARGAPDPFFRGQRRVVLEHVGQLDPADVGDYLAVDGYRALATALQEWGAERVISEVKASGLLGRGGAYFPTGVKWEAARAAAGTPKYLVANGEEGEPGVYKDRHLMEGNPHQVLEGVLIAAFAVGADRGILFVNGEARLAHRRLALALEQARAIGVVGERVLGSDYSFELELRQGAGGFILGEETALIECIEGQRAMPRVRPPFPAERGLYGKPTVVNNVETLSAVPSIVRNGGAWYAGLGHRDAAGTKVFALAGNVLCPGVVEVELGVTLRHLVEDIAGGCPAGQGLKAVLVGGPSGRFLPTDWLGEPLLPRGRFGMGSGGVTLVDERQDMADLASTLLDFNAAESCGKCTPCREGTPRLLELLRAGRQPELQALAEVVSAGSLCGLGQVASLSAESILRFFPQELPR